MQDQTVTCTPQGFELLVSEGRFHQDGWARCVATNARLSADLLAAQGNAARHDVVWPLLASAGVGAVVGFVVAVLVTR